MTIDSKVQSREEILRIINARKIERGMKKHPIKSHECEYLNTTNHGSYYCEAKKKMKLAEKRCDEPYIIQMYKSDECCGLKFQYNLKKLIDIPVTAPVSKVYNKLKKIMKHNIP